MVPYRNINKKFYTNKNNYKIRIKLLIKLRVNRMRKSAI